MSIINGSLPEKSGSRKKSTGSRITAPNGSVISNASSSKISSKASQRNFENNDIVSKRESIVSHTQSEKFRIPSSKCASVVSGVSSQLARRKKKKEAEISNSQQLASRSLSANSLGRRSNENLYGELSKQSKTQSVISLAVADEIHTLKQEERTLILGAIKKCKQNQKHEDRRKQTLKTKINEIKSMRPPFPTSDPKMCYICFNQFWPLFSPRTKCCRCMIMVCKNCVKGYKIGIICSQCALEILYTAQIGSIFNKITFDENDSSNDVDISALERMIVVSSDQERRSKASTHSSDHVDARSIKSKSSTSMGDKLSLLKRKKESSENLSHASTPREGLTNEDDSKSVLSMAMSNFAAEVTDEDNYKAIDGEIMLGLSFNVNKREFTVIVKKCRDLHAVLEKEKTSNPFVRVVLLPEATTEKTGKTKVKYSDLNPVFNEQCKFRNMTLDELIARTVLVTVLHCEWVGKNVFMGQVSIDLSSHSFENATAFWYRLEDNRPDIMPPTLSQYYGDIIFSLKYSTNSDENSVPEHESEQVSNTSQSLSQGSLIIWISHANNLLSSKYNKLPNCYVKCVLLPDLSRDSKKKTHVMRKSLSPVWNIQFSYLNISRQELANVGLEVTVWDKKLGFIPDVLMGGISMNKSRGNKLVNKRESEVWQKMIDKPGTWIEAKLVLRTDIR